MDTHETELTGVQSASTEAGATAYLAKKAQTPSVVDPISTNVLVVGDGDRAEVLDLEHRLAAPTRPRGTYKPATVDALIAHVKRHQDEHHTTIWVHPESGRTVAVFNDHAPTAASLGEDQFATGWRDHQSVLDLKKTDEWVAWTGMDGEMVDQVRFSEHMEKNMQEIVEPDGATMLELAQSFRVAQSASFRSAHWLQSGELQVQYDETLDATAGRSGEIQIPKEFTLAIAPFVGEDPVVITARLRYRMREGKLSLGYQLDRPNVVIRECLQRIADRLRGEFPDVVFIGEPAA